MILSQYQQKFEQCCFVVACCVLPCDKGNAVETKKRMRTAVILQSTFFFFQSGPTQLMHLLPHCVCCRYGVHFVPATILIISPPLLQVGGPQITRITTQPVTTLNMYVAIVGFSSHLSPQELGLPLMWGPVHTCRHTNFICGRCGIPFTLVTTLIISVVGWDPLHPCHHLIHICHHLVHTCHHTNKYLLQVFRPIYSCHIFIILLQV